MNPIFDMLPQIRRARPDLPVIVISAQSTVLTAALASDHGAYDYLPKPFDIDKLAETVRRALQKKPMKGLEPFERRAEKDEGAAVDWAIQAHAIGLPRHQPGDE